MWDIYKIGYCGEFLNMVNVDYWIFQYVDLWNLGLWDFGENHIYIFICSESVVSPLNIRLYACRNRK